MAAADALERVVLGLETSGPGGAEAMVVQLALGLRERGIDVAIATMHPGWMTERAEQAGIPVWSDPMHPGPDPGWVLRLRRRLRRERVDLLHAHEFEMNAYGGMAAWLAGLPSVATLHGSVAGTRPKHLLGYRALGLLGQRQVAVSRNLLDSLRTGLGRHADAIQVIHNGTAVPPLASPAEAVSRREAARAELGLGGGGPLLVAIGSLYPVKDHATLLRAAASLPDVRVAIAGRGDQEEPLRRLAGELGVDGRVHLLGLRDDVPRLLAAADLFVQPSRSEGLPLAVLEAMAHGVCVVATRVGGVAEALVHGESGVLVPPADPEALSRAISDLLEAPERRRSLAEAGWRGARAEFSNEAMTGRYLDLYRELLARRTAPAQRAAAG